MNAPSKIDEIIEEMAKGAIIPGHKHSKTYYTAYKAGAAAMLKLVLAEMEANSGGTTAGILYEHIKQWAKPMIEGE